ncbi:MAG: radical SAM protein, partial [Clostridia bacterium]|nr:radical SAM protein [Clostridia bacterium]
MPSDAVIVRAALHHFEEPCISGTRGSGTVFFAGCNLRCAFCQNRDISRGFGSLRKDAYTVVDAVSLRRIFYSLIEQGAHNINLVTPSHYAHIIAEALDEKLPVPVVWNSSGYDLPETLDLLRGKVDIFMPDMKYSCNALARDLSKAPD